MLSNLETGLYASQRNFLNLIISKLDKHIVLLPINDIARTEKAYSNSKNSTASATQ